MILSFLTLFLNVPCILRFSNTLLSTSDPLFMALPSYEIPTLQSLPAENLIHHHCKLDVTISVELLRYSLSWIPQIILDKALTGCILLYYY